MARVDGFDVKFTHRGSWKASLLVLGKCVAEIPVAWQTDRSGNTILVWFKTHNEACERLTAAKRFRIAVATKNANGSTNSSNITGIFWVIPIEVRLDGHHPRLFCEVEARAKPSD